MSKLTASQVASRIGMTPYTIKRWYEFYKDLTEEERMHNMMKYGMPELPDYEVVGVRGDRVWDEKDVPALEAFRDWVPHTRNGIFKKCRKEEEND